MAVIVVVVVVVVAVVTKEVCIADEGAWRASVLEGATGWPGRISAGRNAARRGGSIVSIVKVAVEGGGRRSHGVDGDGY